MSKVLVACEESQTVTIELRKLGHKAYSCDIEPCSGGYPDWHLKQDVTPCTYLTVTGNRWFDIDRYGEKAIQRYKDREKAIEFFMLLANADCEKIAIENPVGIMSSYWRKPDQIIHPYYFGDPFEKKTCLWLKGLPKLKYTNIVTPPERSKYSSGKTMSTWYANAPIKERSKLRSKTFGGIAKAMAYFWGGE